MANDYAALYQQYLNAVKGNFTKIAKLDFLNRDGTTAFTIDNAPRNKRRGAFLQDGSLSVNFQNGTRRTASVTLSNLDNEYDYNINKLWFGQNVRLSEGLVLPDGTDYYISQGVFGIKDPGESWQPGNKTITLNLVDKWAYLDGTLFGNLDGIYEVPVGTDIYGAIQSILSLSRGSQSVAGVIDNSPPIVSAYFKNYSYTLPSGETVLMSTTPYTLRVDSDNGTYADVLLGLNEMMVGVIGYDSNGQLRVEPSQELVDDAKKEILWRFSPEDTQLLGATYSVLNSQVYNDIIVQGETQDNYAQPYGRATNTNRSSDMSIYTSLGKRTLRISAAGYASDKQCADRAKWELKQNCILKKSVTIECSQIFHIQENRIVSIVRTDKPGEPEERHLVTGFTRPIGQTGSMTINATSVNDITLTTIGRSIIWPFPLPWPYPV